MTKGRVITEHDVTEDRWYLDGGHIPTCIAVEAGQADLFLSGYLGIDFIAKGKAVYRLLDAVVTFHRGLPEPGDVIRYDIKIDHFFRQDKTYLFRFNFEGTVNGEPLLSMENGCAGFFTAEELAAGQASVAIHYRGNEEGAAQVATAIRDAGGTCAVFQADVGKAEDAADLVKRVEKELGRIDILVNNAGTTRDTLLMTMKEEDQRWTPRMYQPKGTWLVMKSTLS